MHKFILTNYKHYTDIQVVNMFSEHVRPENVEILVNHLSYPELAECILSFTEIDGFIHFNLGNGEGLLKVTPKKSSPI